MGYRVIATTLLTLAVTGCGVAATSSSLPGAGATATTSATDIAPPAVSTPASTPSAPIPVATPTATPVPAPRPSSTMTPAATPAQMAHTASSTSVFAILPLLAGGPRGSVAVSTSAAGTRYHVVITGLTPGSGHTVHDHLGSCGSAATSTHLRVLTTAAADSQGSIVFDTAVPSTDAGAGRIVIVYNTTRANLIVGCADL